VKNRRTATSISWAVTWITSDRCEVRHFTVAAFPLLFNRVQESVFFFAEILSFSSRFLAAFYHSFLSSSTIPRFDPAVPARAILDGALIAPRRAEFAPPTHDFSFRGTAILRRG